jgi:hypothetical protein
MLTALSAAGSAAGLRRQAVQQQLSDLTGVLRRQVLQSDLEEVVAVVPVELGGLDEAAA